MAVTVPLPVDDSLAAPADRDAPGTFERRVALGTTVVVPAALIIALGFQSGGFPRGTTALAATLVGLLLLVRAVIAPSSVQRPGWIGTLGIAALASLAAWQLLSAEWSDSAWRAIAEFNRTALYLLVFVTFATLPKQRMKPVLASVGLGIVVIALAGLLSRLRPDLIPVAVAIAPQRLSYPLGYWNGMGVFVACGLVLCLHVAADQVWPFAARALAATAVPALAATLYLTLSRGGLGAAAVGIGLYVVLGRPRGLIPALVAIVPPAVFVLLAAYDASALVTPEAANAEVIEQGRALATTVLVGCVAAGGLRLLLWPADGWLSRVRVPSVSRQTQIGAAAVVLVAIVVGGLAVDAPSRVRAQVDGFLASTPTTPSGDPRQRLTSVNNGGRIEHWEVAMEASAEHRLRGVGAGTFDIQWREYRSSTGLVTEAHSLYVETLSELGVVGLLALVALIASLAAGAFARRYRRPASAAVFAVVMLWALHAALDWDWEIPAVTLVPLILGAAAASAPRRQGAGRRLAPVVVCVGAVLLVALPAISAVAESRVTQALAALEAGDCATAAQRAAQGARFAPARSDLLSVEAVCASREGRNAKAIELSRAAVASDPHDWEAWFLQGLVQATAGKDPRPALQRARALDPLGTPTQKLLQLTATSDAQVWESQGAGTFLWIHGRPYGPIRL